MDEAGLKGKNQEFGLGHIKFNLSVALLATQVEMLRRQLDIYEPRILDRGLSCRCKFGSYQYMDIKATRPAEMTKGVWDTPNFSL